jgi:hypothetical protein
MLAVLLESAAIIDDKERKADRLSCPLLQDLNTGIKQIL